MRCLVIVMLVVGMVSVATAAFTDGLIAHWTLDDGDGDSAIDSVGTNHGTLMNEPAWVGGNIGGALNFDGTDDYVELPAIVLDDFSVAFWVKTTQDPADGPHWHYGNGLVDAEKFGTIIL